MATAELPKVKVRFVSRRDPYRIVRKPAVPKYNAMGAYMGDEPGKAVQFTDGQYITDDADEIDFLRRALAGHAAGDIFEVGFADVPASDEKIAEVMDAAIAGDVNRLAELHEEETETYKRQDVLTAARQALSRLEPPVEAPEAPAPTD